VGQSVSGDSKILNRADFNPRIVAKPVSAVLHLEARHMQMFGNSELAPDADSGKSGTGKAHAKRNSRQYRQVSQTRFSDASHQE
jgi:hypothetical protein